MNTAELLIIAGVALTIVGFRAIWKLEIVSYIYDVRLTADGIEFCLFRFWIDWIGPRALMARSGLLTRKHAARLPSTLRRKR